jgi:hypothetical protein
MIRILSAATLPLLLLAACGAPPPPAEAPEPGTLTVITPQPQVRSLIGFRDRLSLTSEQVSALDSIATWMEEANRPHREVVRARTGQRPAGLPDDALRAAAEAISANHQSADRAVAALLSEEQRAAACGIGRAAGAQAATAPAGQRPAAGRTDPRAPVVRTGWSWCAPEQPARAPR